MSPEINKEGSAKKLTIAMSCKFRVAITTEGVNMAGIMLLINIAAAWSNYGKTEASGYAVASLIASIWAFGIFSNFRRDPMSAPGYAVLLSTASGITGLVLLIIGLSA